MHSISAFIALAFCISSCSTSVTDMVHEPPQPTASGERQDRQLITLDGLVVQGSIRARGITGLFSVRGTLSFRDGMLIWATQEAEDIGPYTLIKTDKGFTFKAEHIIENDEHVLWTGSSDGQNISNVTAIWTRAKGDLVHDVLLPDQVTLIFTPDK